jgi:hypothetical protein
MVIYIETSSLSSSLSMGLDILNSEQTPNVKLTNGERWDSY